MHGKKRATRREIFEKEVPQAFLRDWLLALVLRNKAVNEHVATRYSPQAAAQAAPQMRRMSHEDALHELGLKHGGASAWVWNEGQTHQHVEVVFGKVVLTQNMVHEEAGLPRYAKFRAILARRAQMVFDFVHGLTQPKAEATEEHRVYAQLLHGPPRWRAKAAGMADAFPGFARVAFPINGSDQFDDYISLNRMLTSLIYREQTEEHISDDLQLELKPKPEENEDDD